MLSASDFCSGKAIYLGKGYLEVDYDCKPGCEYACTPFTVRGLFS